MLFRKSRVVPPSPNADRDKRGVGAGKGGRADEVFGRGDGRSGSAFRRSVIEASAGLNTNAPTNKHFTRSSAHAGSGLFEPEPSIVQVSDYTDDRGTHHRDDLPNDGDGAATDKPAQKTPRKKRNRWDGDAKTGVRTRKSSNSGAWRFVRGVFALSFIVFVSYVFITLLPDYSRQSLTIAAVNVSLIPEELQEPVRTEVQTYLKEYPDMLHFNSSNAEAQISKRFPQLQNLRVSMLIVSKTVAVSGQMRESAALVRTLDKYYLIDSSGFVIEQVSLGELGTMDLPHVALNSATNFAIGAKTNDEMVLNCLILLDVIRECNRELYNKVAEVAYVYRDDEETTSIAMQLAGGLEVRLDGGQVATQLWKYDVFEKLVRGQLRVNPLYDVAYVDLRFRRQIPFMLRSTEREQIKLPTWAQSTALMPNNPASVRR